jgi:parallel beta-helix repeat protein
VKRTPRRVVPVPGLVIREDTILEPGEHVIEAGRGIVIDADGITVDARGVVLRARAALPPLPADDVLYSPGDLGVSRETHELLVRGFPLDTSGSLVFEYRSWSRDDALVAVSSDGSTWRAVAVGARAPLSAGWVRRRFPLGDIPAGRFWLRFSVPSETVSSEAPPFFDSFRILRGDQIVWQGDARDHWKQWYNTGFSIFRRDSRSAYAGVGIQAEGRTDVRLRGCTVRGFMTGLSLRECSGWTIEGNDFSGNYDCPDYGWGEGTEGYGALFLDRVTDSLVRRNRGCRVWNGIVLRRCTGITLERNIFSHCSNTCLKLSQSSRNTIRNNDFSWGLRIYPTEVHARDSVSLLVESGSDDNRFIGNDFRHGGDGIFIRVLDYWCSTGNRFERNDCSYANNNAVESWSPGNTYIGNRADWSSYGFWLGGSDDTILAGNSVRNNGKIFRNAPEPFGNAGVSVVHGASTRFVMSGNRVTGNSGPGLSLAFTETTPAKLWLVAGNRIQRNRDDVRGYAGHGALLEFCEDILIGRNDISGNDGRDIAVGRGARRVVLDGRIRAARADLRLDVAAPVIQGNVVRLAVVDAAGRPWSAAKEAWWDFGDGVQERAAPGAASGPTAHVYARPGRYRVCATLIGRREAGIASRTVCVLPPGTPLADCGAPRAWSLRADGSSRLGADTISTVSGRESLVAEVRAGTLSTLRADFPSPRDLSAARGIGFFYKYACDLSLLVHARGRRVGLRLISARGYLERFPETPFDGTPSEDRYDWVFFEARRDTLTGDGDLTAVTGLEILFGPEAAADCIFRLDAILAW